MTKRLFDVVISALALFILAPLIVIIALLVNHRLGSPVLFKQVRAGLNGKPFTMYKFRTMLDSNGPDGKPLPDIDRMTRFGAVLRSTSIDELPELWNVLKGDMSLVGPRPLLMDYLPLYSEQQFKRHNVRPGITGWAQVNGRNHIPWDERFKMDVWYVENKGLILDLKILLLTVMKVLIRESVNTENGGLMPRFEGSKKKDTDNVQNSSNK